MVNLSGFLYTTFGIKSFKADEATVFYFYIYKILVGANFYRTENTDVCDRFRQYKDAYIQYFVADEQIVCLLLNIDFDNISFQMVLYYHSLY